MTVKNSKVAIVYDWIDKWGGVERILLTLHQIFPQAEFYTSYFDPRRATWAKDLNIKTSFIQKLPFFLKRSRLLSFPFYPYAFESFDLSSYHLVISVTSSFAKSVVTKPNTFHLCYLLTPNRYLWLMTENYLKNDLIKSLVSPYLAKIREWDFIASQRPDEIISISKTVAERCQKYYRRKSEVIYPPFDLKYWQEIKSKVKNLRSETISKFEKLRKPYFLLVSRLEPYKKVDLVIKTFNQINESLVIIGKGTKSKSLKKMAKENVLFFHDLTDQELAFFYQNAKALIMPQEEDFGYISLEAQFFGCPVIAFRKGGATETVIENKTGFFFNEQKIDSLLNALKKFHTISYQLKNSVKKIGEKNVSKFDKKIFKKNLLNFLSKKFIKKNSN